MFFWNSLEFFDDPADVGNLISGSSAFSKTSLQKTLLDILTRLFSDEKRLHPKILSALKYWECTKLKRTKVGIGGEWRRGRREEDRHLPSDLADRLKANGCVSLSVVAWLP